MEGADGDVSRVPAPRATVWKARARKCPRPGRGVNAAVLSVPYTMPQYRQQLAFEPRRAGEWTERRPGPPGWLTLRCELDHLDAPVGRRLPTCAAAPTVDGPLERKCVRDATLPLHVAGPGRATLARDRRAFSYSTAERRKRNLFSPVVARASRRGRRDLQAGSSSAPRWRARATGGRVAPRGAHTARGQALAATIYAWAGRGGGACAPWSSWAYLWPGGGSVSLSAFSRCAQWHSRTGLQPTGTGRGITESERLAGPDSRARRRR